jgi:hypothetical protein
MPYQTKQIKGAQDRLNPTTQKMILWKVKQKKLNHLMRQNSM